MLKFKKLNNFKKKNSEFYSSKRFHKKRLFNLLKRMADRAHNVRAERLLYNFESINGKKKSKFIDLYWIIYKNFYPRDTYILSNDVIENVIAFSFEFSNSKLKEIYFKNILKNTIVIYLDKLPRSIKFRKKNVKIFKLSKIFKKKNKISDADYVNITVETILTDLKIPTFVDIYFIGYNIYKDLNYIKSNIIEKDTSLYKELVKIENTYQLVNKFQFAYSNIWVIDINFFFNFQILNIQKVIPYRDIVQINKLISKQFKLKHFKHRSTFRLQTLNNNLIAYIGDKIIRSIMIISEAFRKNPPIEFSSKATFNIAKAISGILNYEAYSYSKCFNFKNENLIQIYEYDIYDIYKTLIQFTPEWNFLSIKNDLYKPENLHNFFLKNPIAIGDVYINYKFKQNIDSFIINNINQEFNFNIEGNAKISVQKFIIFFEFFETVNINSYNIYIIKDKCDELSAISENIAKLNYFFIKIKQTNRILFKASNKLVGNLSIFYNVVNINNPDATDDLNFIFIKSILDAIKLEYIIYFYKTGNYNFLFMRDGFMTSKNLDKTELFGVGIYSRCIFGLILSTQDYKNIPLTIFRAQSNFEFYILKEELEFVASNTISFYEISQESNFFITSIKWFSNDLYNVKEYNKYQIDSKNKKFYKNDFIQFYLKFKSETNIKIFVKKSSILNDLLI